MRIKTYAIIISLIIHSLLTLPLFAKKPEIKTFTLSVHKIEFVPSKVTKKEKVIFQKSFHGKKKKRKIVETVNKPIQVKGNEIAQQYFSKVRESFLSNSSTSIKAQKLKLKGEVLIKVQIQNNGHYDILYVGGDIKELEVLANRTLDKISKFPPIPKELGQKEIQLKIPLQYKFE